MYTIQRPEINRATAGASSSGKGKRSCLQGRADGATRALRFQNHITTFRRLAEIRTDLASPSNISLTRNFFLRIVLPDAVDYPAFTNKPWATCSSTFSRLNSLEKDPEARSRFR